MSASNLVRAESTATSVRIVFKGGVSRTYHGIDIADSIALAKLVWNETKLEQIKIAFGEGLVIINADAVAAWEFSRETLGALPQ